MMVMMGCFSLLRLDQPWHQALVLLPGNLMVAGSLFVGAAAVAMRRRLSLAIGLFSAAITAVMGIVALRSEPGSTFLRLPGYPFIWVVIGLYIAFRLVINQQHEQRKQQAERQRRNAAAPPDDGGAARRDGGGGA